MRFTALGLVCVLAACQSSGGGPARSTARALPGAFDKSALPGIQVGDAMLDPQALAAEAAFHYPEQTRVLVRGLLRTEFAAREAARLGLRVDQEALEKSLGDAIAALENGLAAGDDFESWARDRYGRNGEQVKAAFRKRFADNQLYQVALRADAWMNPRYRVQMLVGLDEGQAKSWARRLRAGANPTTLAEEAADRGPRGDGSYPPLAAYLPEPLGSALASAAPGDVIGPFQFADDRTWRVVRLIGSVPAGDLVPPTSELIAGLRSDPVTDIEARAWFEEMSRRYTAAERLPGIQTPDPTFVRVQRP